VIYPDDDVIAPAQASYIGEYLNAVGRAFGSPEHIDPTSQRSVEELVDVDAMIDHHALSALAKNPDAFRLSAYMYKDRGGKLVAGPLWDCDRCMGSQDSRSADPNGWSPNGDGTSLFEYGHYAGLFANPALEARYWARLGALIDGPLSADAMIVRVESMAAELEEAAERNFARFPGVGPEGGLYRNEIDTLETWLEDRVSFMRDNLGMR
jgi:hypothetical protein